MNLRILVAGFAAIALFSAGCGEESENSLQCPPEVPAVLQPVHVLVMTGFVDPEHSAYISDSLLDCGMLPAGSTVDTFSLLDHSRTLVIPSPGYLDDYDALIVFTNAWPLDPVPAAYDTIGNLLADYVDAGGGLVACQFMISGLAAGIRGRIVSPGYAPLEGGALEMVDEQVDRTIVLESLEFPLHPVFAGIDIERIKLCSTRFSIGRPDLDGTAILLAADDMGTNAVAINASGSIVGINTYYLSFVLSEEYAETVKLAANALLFVSGAYPD